MTSENCALRLTIGVFVQSRHRGVDDAVLVSDVHIAAGNHVVVCKFLLCGLNVDGAATAVIHAELSADLQRRQKKDSGREYGRGNSKFLALLSHNELPILGLPWFLLLLARCLLSSAYCR